MSRAVVGASIATAAVLSEKVQAAYQDGFSDAVVNGGDHTAAALRQLLLAQDVAPNNPPEGLSEHSDAVGVDEGVDHRVAVGENDGHVHDAERRAITLRTEEGEAVDDV